MDSPIVSVVIITYNSSKYILDCLDSIYNQTYENVELIISDDCSKDDTVDICKEWLSEKKNRFVRTELITVDKNTGTSANCNRGIHASSGVWVKLIAGDDALFPNSIEEFIQFSIKHPDTQWIVGKFVEFENTFDEANIVKFHDYYNNNSEFLSLPAEQQFKKMIYGNTFILPIAMLIQTEALRTVGGCDEKYGILDDHPLFLKLLKAGFKCYEMDECVGKYRVSDSNVAGSMTQLFNYRLRKADFQVAKDLCFQYYSKREILRCYTSFITIWIMNKFGLKKNTRINRVVMKVLRFVFVIFTFDYEFIHWYFQAMKDYLSYMFPLLKPKSLGTH